VRCFKKADRRATYGIGGEDFGSKEGVIFREGAVVENKKELDTALQSLEGMRNTSALILVLEKVKRGQHFTYGGKNQTSPAFRSSTKVSPSSLTASTLTLPFKT